MSEHNAGSDVVAMKIKADKKGTFDTVPQNQNWRVVSQDVSCNLIACQVIKWQSETVTCWHFIQVTLQGVAGGDRFPNPFLYINS